MGGTDEHLRSPILPVVSGGHRKAAVDDAGLSRFVASHNKRRSAELVRAGADVSIKGTGTPCYAGKTAADLAEEAGATQLAADIRHPAR